MDGWSRPLDMMCVEMFPVPPPLVIFPYAKFNVQMILLIMLALRASNLFENSKKPYDLVCSLKWGPSIPKKNYGTHMP